MTSEEIHTEAVKRFTTADNKDEVQRASAIRDMIFVHAEDGQWDEDAIERRRDRPRYTINRVAGAVDQIVGDQRQNRIAVKVSPRDETNQKLADIFTGLIRNIEQTSSAVNAYDQAFEETVTGGYGGWRILTDFEADDSFDQEIHIEPINSAASSLYFDPNAQRYDKRDAEFAFLITRMSEEAFKEAYPDASPVDWELSNAGGGLRRTWFRGNQVRVAEYWFKEPIKKKIGLLSDGRIIDLDEEKAVLDELAATGVRVVQERTVDSHRVKSVIMSGVELLTEVQDWAGKFIPLIPIFGKTAHVNGENFTRGIVRMAKDAQRIYNYATSSAVEATALTPKDPIWITAVQAKGNEASLRTFPTANTPYMFYTADPLAPGPPARGGAPQLQTALLQQISQAATDIHSTTGLEPASLGNVPELKSGKAIRAQQAMGDRGAFVFRDNLAKSIAYTGEILVDLLPRIYDTERIVQILGVDGVTESVTINEPETNELNQPIIDEETGEQVIVNDLSQGRYTISIATGPSFSTKREETVEQLVTLAGQSPVIQELALDLIVKNMDLNVGDEIERLIRKRMITEKIIEPTDEEREELGLDQPPAPDPMNEELIRNLAAQTEKLQIDGEKVISEVENKDADTQKKIMETQKVSVDSLVAIREIVIKKIQAGIPITPEEIELIRGQSVIVEETQGNVLSGGEVARSVPLGNPQIPQA